MKGCLFCYFQIVTSAHYMLSDVYIPVSTDPTCPGLSDEQPASASCEDEEECGDEAECDAIKSLCISQPQPIPSNNNVYNFTCHIIILLVYIIIYLM